MKRIQKIAVLFTTLLVMGQGVNAQDYAFSQFYANPLYLNPALAGSKVCPRFSLNYRNQWPGLVSAFTTVSASYDQYFERLHGGIGAYVLTDRQGDHGALKTTHAAFMYSFRFQVSRTVYINAALQASLVNQNLDWSVLRFPDQIDPDFGFIFDTKAVPPDDVNLFYADFNAGVVAYSKDWYAGVSVAHLTQPDVGFYGLSQLPMKITVHGGGLINLAEDQRRTSFLDLGSPVVSPNLIYQHQGGFNYFNYGLYLDWIPFMVGAWFRHGIENADAFTFLIGIQQPQFKLGYSYDVTVSKLSNQSHGSHEITLGFMLPCPDKPHRVKTISCPSF